MIPRDKHDPQRSIALAVNAARTLGGLLCIIGGILVVLAMWAVAGPSQYGAAVALGQIVAAGILVVPGILFLIFASHLKAAQPWAATWLIVLSALTMVP